MFSMAINDTSRVVRIMLIGDATTWSVTSDNSRGVIYNCNVFIIQATGGRKWKLIYPDTNGSVPRHLVEKYFVDTLKRLVHQSTVVSTISMSVSNKH